MKVGEVRIDLQDPVRLYKYYGSNVDPRHAAGEEGFVLEPCDDIVQGPRSVEKDGTDGEPPVVDRTIKEYEEAVPHAEDELHERSAIN